jgi:hypothetical protein
VHWTVAAAFTRDPETDRWLVPFVPGDRHRFTMIPAPVRRSWHDRKTRTAGLEDWASAWNQGRRAWRESNGGVITLFPQIAMATGLRQRVGAKRKPIVAWTFNMGALYPGIKQRVARIALAQVDRFIVHARAEVSRYADWLGLLPSRFSFVHLQRAPISIEKQEDTQEPFLLSMGSAKRDYATLFEAVRGSKRRTVVVAAKHALEGLDVPPNVTVLSSLPAVECYRLAQQARINVVTVLNDQTASGQVTIVEAMRMGRAVIATRCMGSEDYVEHGVTGLLVEPRSVESLRTAIERLWDDAALREQLASGAAAFTAAHCSDEAAGAALQRILDEVEESTK